jgi:hypothetical protein
MNDKEKVFSVLVLSPQHDEDSADIIIFIVLEKILMITIILYITRFLSQG